MHQPRPRPAAASTHRARGSPTRRGIVRIPHHLLRLDVHLREEHTAAAAPGDPARVRSSAPPALHAGGTAATPASTAAPSGRRDVVRATRGDRRCRLHGVWDLNPSNPSSANPSSVASPAPIIPAAMSSIMFATNWLPSWSALAGVATAGAAAESSAFPRVPVRARGAAGEASSSSIGCVVSSEPTTRRGCSATLADARRVDVGVGLGLGLGFGLGFECRGAALGGGGGAAA